MAYDDGAVGRVEQNLAKAVGDFVLRRGDGVFAYQLAVIVDDAEESITDVVRGADLVASTPRQIWLAGQLGLAVPRYTHVALVVAGDGQRLEKRTRGATVRELRAAGATAERILGELAFGLGIAPSNQPASARSIAAGAAGKPLRWRTAPWPIPVAVGGPPVDPAGPPR